MDPTEAGGAGAGGGAREGGAATAAGRGGEGGEPYPGEPTGPALVTLVNGIVDAPRVAFCVTTSDGTRSSELSPPGGLEYATAVAMGELSGIDIATEDLTLHVVAGSDELLFGLDCAGALALAEELAHGGSGGEGGASFGAGAGGLEGAFAPPAVRAAALAVLPRGTLTLAQSSLLVARGCLGGVEGTGVDLARICGASTGAAGPGPAPVFARLSRRVDAGAIGVMAVHAATPVNTGLATGESIDLALTAGDLEPLEVVADLQPGAVAPVPPHFVSAEDWAARVPAGAVLVRTEGSPAATLPVAWDGILARSGGVVPAAGDTIALIVVGPGVGVEPGPGPWNPLTVAQIVVASAAQ